MTSQPDLFGAPDVGGERDAFDRYYSPPWTTKAFIDHMGTRLQGPIWEPCCGDGTGIVLPLREAGFEVYASDYRVGGDVLADAEQGLDFLSVTPEHPMWGVPWIVTNTPYFVTQNGDVVLASDFARHALRVASKGVALQLRVGWIEPCEDRYPLLTSTPPTDYIVLPRPNYVGAPKGNNQTALWYGFDFEMRTQLDSLTQAGARGSLAFIHHYPPEIREATFDWSRLASARPERHE